MYIIIEDVHQFINLCLIPLDPWNRQLTYFLFLGGNFNTSPRGKLLHTPLKSFIEEKTPPTVTPLKLSNGQSTESLESLSDEISNNTRSMPNTHTINRRVSQFSSHFLTGLNSQWFLVDVVFEFLHKYYIIQIAESQSLIKTNFLHVSKMVLRIYSIIICKIMHIVAYVDD